MPASASKALLKTFYHDMLRIRRAEDAILSLFAEGLVHGTTHTCNGQEASPVGVLAALGRNTMVFSNHRGHGHYLAHHGTVKELLAEILGREGGTCGGWGGSQHLKTPRFFLSSGIQGGGLPAALGSALSFKLEKSNRIACAFIGDGTLGEGIVYECLNLASLWKLPLFIVVEDNGIAQTTPKDFAVAGSISKRFEAFGIPCAELTDPTPMDVKDAAEALAANLRDGKGPAALTLNLPRLNPHSKGDDTRGAAELSELRSRDPLKKMEALLPNHLIEEIQNAVEKEIREAVRFAKESPEPKTCAEEKKSPDKTASGKPGALRVRDQLQEALRDLLKQNPKSLLLGEDILGPYGGAFKVTGNLSLEFPNRVIPTPISEAAIVGTGLGLALQGWTAVVELMFGDFLFLSADQLLNQAAKYAKLLHEGGLNLVIRAPMGGRRGYGPTHSQSIEKHFLGMPGLTVIAPNYLHDAKTMLTFACERGHPVLFIENKLDYGRTPQLDENGLIGDLKPKFSGSAETPVLSLSFTDFEEDAATILCYGGMLPIAMEAARELLIQHEKAIRIVAPSLLSPCDLESVANALAPNGPVLTVEEHTAEYGWGQSLCAMLASEKHLRAPFLNLGAKNTVIPSARSLEDIVLPGKKDIMDAVLKLT